MKRILVIITLIVNLLIRPLFASHSIESELPVQAGVEKKLIREQIAERKLRAEKAQAEIRQEALRLEQERQAGLQRIKMQQEAEEKERDQRAKEEAKKQEAAQELQRKIDELRIQEEAAEKEKALKQEALLKEKLAREKSEDLPGQMAYIFGALARALKQYEAHDVKSGDALLSKTSTELKDTFNKYSPSEIKKIIATMRLKPETHFMILNNLMELYADHTSMVQGGSPSTFVRLIAALFDTIDAENFRQFLMTDQSSKTLHNIQIRLLPVIETPRPNVLFERLNFGEQLFSIMISFTKKIVEALNRKHENSDQYVLNEEQRQHVATILLDWVRNCPVTETTQEQLLIKALQGLEITSLPQSSEELRDWIYIFKNIKEKRFLQALIKTYLDVIFEERNFNTLRNGLRTLSIPQLNMLAPNASLMALKHMIIITAADPDVLKNLGDEDIITIINTVKELVEQQWADGQALLESLISELEKTIIGLELKPLIKSSDTAYKNEIIRVEKLKVLRGQLQKLHMSKRFLKPEKSYRNNILTWDQKTTQQKLFNITHENYKDGVFVNAKALIDSLLTFNSALSWYQEQEDNHAYAHLMRKAQEYYIPKTFELLANKNPEFLRSVAEILTTKDEYTIYAMITTLKNIIATFVPYKNLASTLAISLTDFAFKQHDDKQFVRIVQKLPQSVFHISIGTIFMEPHSEQQVKFINAMTDEQFEIFTSFTLKKAIDLPQDQASILIKLVDGILQLTPSIKPDRALQLLQAVGSVDYPNKQALKTAITTIERRIQEQQEAETKKAAEVKLV